MRIIKSLIIDDEPLARDIIKSHLDKMANWSVVKSCMNAYEAYDEIQNHNIDVIFLDIQMPNLTGIEFLKSLQNPPLVIFTTAYSDYAVESYELNVVDYLLKPIMFPRFIQAVQKIESILTSRVSGTDQTSDLTFCFFKYNGKLLKIEFDDIIYIKAEQEYSYIFTKNDKLLISMHLKKIQELLSPYLFFRTHRSYLVALDKIEEINGNLITLFNAHEVPVSRTSKQELLDRLHIR